MTAPTLEGLEVRPGSAFDCFSDGLCCYDMHAFGPLSEPEADLLRAFSPEVVQEHQGSLVILSTVEGRCIFASDRGCEIHARLGPQVKPLTCRQFPFSFIATPLGGRVATEHRCPCRTMGARPLLDVPRVLDAVGITEVELTPDRTIYRDLVWQGEEVLSWEAYRVRESALLDNAPEQALRETFSLEAFKHLPREEWLAVASELASSTANTRYEAALRGFAWSLRSLLQTDAGEMRQPDVHWKDAFDRAENRSEPLDPELMLADWLADEIWSLAWPFRGSFYRAAQDWVARLAICRHLQRYLVSEGRRADRAMAEAISMIELAGLSDAWVAAIAHLPE